MVVVGLQVFLLALVYTSLCLAGKKLPFNKLTVLLSDILRKLCSPPFLSFLRYSLVVSQKIEDGDCVEIVKLWMFS